MNSIALKDTKSLFLSDIEAIPLLTKEEEYDLAVKFYEKNDLDAANKLVISNLRFVLKIASEYKSYGFPLMDLVQEGTVGLMHAVKKFDPYKGYRLISYAVWWIRASIHNHIMKFWSNVKIGTTQAQRKLFQKISGAKKRLKLSPENTSAENISELAEHFGVRDSDIEEMEMRIKSRDFSLNSTIVNDDSMTYMDLLNDDAPNHEQLISDAESNNIKVNLLKKGLKQLNTREAKIISDRYLIEKRKTLEEIGQELNISKERVRQVEKKSLEKIKKLLMKDKIITEEANL